jgi:transcriptional regulator GlxA family with amidase domain
MVDPRPPAKGRAGQSAGTPGQALPVTVDLLVTERCFGSGVAVTRDVLATANLLSAALGGPPAIFAARVLSREGRAVHTSTGAILPVDGSIAEANGAVAVAFGPGMADVKRVLEDVARLDARVIAARLGALHGQGSVVCASCSSTFLLAESGALDGEAATTSWWLTPIFRERYPAVELLEDAIVVPSNRVITAGAALAQIDLALELVRRFGGAELARAVSRYLLVEESRPSQSPFLILEHLAMNDELVLAADRLLREDLARPLDLAGLARKLGVSVKTLGRRFRSATGLPPAQFHRRLRLEAAQRLLRAGRASIARIAERVGYDDERAFRRAFERDFGVSPARFRAAARASR